MFGPILVTTNVLLIDAWQKCINYNKKNNNAENNYFKQILMFLNNFKIK